MKPSAWTAPSGWDRSDAGLQKAAAASPDSFGSAPSLADLPTADFFDFESLLSVQEQRKLNELRDFLATEIAPYAGQWWDKAEFPDHILPKLAALRLSAPAQRGYTHLFAGLVIAEMTRVDTSIATFFMVHHDLFIESLYEFGSEHSKTATLTTPRTSGRPVPSR